MISLSFSHDLQALITNNHSLHWREEGEKSRSPTPAFKQKMQAVSTSQLNHNYEQKRQVSGHLKAGTKA